MTLAPGTRLGAYEILSALGAGGMGEVYRACDTRLDRSVAIKILPEALAADPRFRERFDREAKIISRLDHPNICALYDVGTQDVRPFLVMQYLEGETLAEQPQTTSRWSWCGSAPATPARSTRCTTCADQGCSPSCCG